MTTGELIRLLSRYDDATPISVYDKSGDVYLNPVIDDISINNAVVIRKIYFNPKTNKTEEWALKK